MNLFDLALLAVVLFSAVSGLRTGFARVVIHVAATFAALLAAFWCYRIVAVQLTFIPQPLAANITGFCLLFFGIMILGSIVGAVIARFFKLVGLGWLDHFLGGAAGILRGALLVAVAVAVAIAFTPSPTPSFLRDSKVAPYATALSGVLADMAPLQIREGFFQQMRSLKQFWLHPTTKDQRMI